MAWYDGIVSTIGDAYDNVVEAGGELLDEWVGVEKDRVAEKLIDPVDTTETQPTPNTYRKPAASGIDWQKVGVIVGALGVGVGIYKLVKG